MKAGTGERSASSARSGLTATSSAIMVTKVSAVWTSPKVVEIISTGRLIESVCARRSKSYEAGSS